MEIIFTIVGQVSIMYILMAIGFIVYRKKLINEDGAKQISNLFSLGYQSNDYVNTLSNGIFYK
ncbi:hypothetical protein DZE42_000791 [Clostridium beijerinckii]|uniref:hypothetical protein n=1 Tax=Clostridium beijerinckii TaxID=1520 RepID=UPI001F4BF7D6|nr:hypothetical protein [Clostridium beijerinckii]NRZ57652.1 hypothetical protein [Clostridium beijerinckii]